jgi:hypothetical protein
MTIIDAQKNPEAVSLLLSGRLNVAVCPQCGYAGALGTPLVYHDAEKEILYTFLPSQLDLPQMEEEKILGDLTSRVMSSLPPEERKGYLLQPRRFLSFDSLIEAVLEAEGVTPEMLEAQERRAELLNQLLQEEDADEREAAIREAEEAGEIDAEFLQLLTLNMEMAEAQGLGEVAQQLTALREQLLDWTRIGQDVADREAAVRELGTEITREGLLEKLVEAALADKQGRIETLVAVARPAIDYAFYQMLSERIDQARASGDGEQADKLQALRETILEITSAIDAQVQQATQETAARLEQILERDDVEQAVREALPYVDDLFLSILVRNIQAAEQAGRTAEAEKMQRVANALMQIIQESQPPEIRFINRLLEEDDPAARQTILEENRDQVNEQLLQIMDMIGQDLAENRRDELAQRLEAVRQQAARMVAGSTIAIAR